MSIAILTSTTGKCVVHLLQHWNGIAPLVQRFCGVASVTVQKWAAGRVPVGITLLKLRCFLENLGYEVTELKALQPEVRNFGRLVAFDIISVADAVAQLGVNTDSTFRLLGGKAGTSAHRLRTMREVYEANAEQLKVAVTALESEISKINPEVRRVERSGCQPERSEPSRPPPNAMLLQSTIEVLAMHIRAMVPLAELVASDAFTAEDRERLRMLAGDKGYAVFNLKNALVQLCGERARKNLNS